MMVTAFATYQGFASPARAQVLPEPPQPQLRDQHHHLNNFDLTSIGIVLVVVMVILGLRRLIRRSQ